MAVTNYYTVNEEIIGEHTAGQSSLDYLPDALRSVIETVDQTLTVQSTARYKPYGAELATTGSQPRFGYVGGPGFRRTGQSYCEYYVRYRHEAATAAVWTTVDPLWPTEPVYLYANANPTTLIDRSGLTACAGQGPSLPPIDLADATPCVQMAFGWWSKSAHSRASIFHDCQQMLQAQYNAQKQLGVALTCPGGYWQICQVCSQVTGLPINCGAAPAGEIARKSTNSDSKVKQAVRGCLKLCFYQNKPLKECLKDCAKDKTIGYVWEIYFCKTHPDWCRDCGGKYLCDCADDNLTECTYCALAEWEKCLVLADGDSAAIIVCDAKKNRDAIECNRKRGAE